MRVRTTPYGAQAEHPQKTGKEPHGRVIGDFATLQLDPKERPKTARYADDGADVASSRQSLAQCRGLLQEALLAGLHQTTGREHGVLALRAPDRQTSDSRSIERTAAARTAQVHLDTGRLLLDFELSEGELRRLSYLAVKAPVLRDDPEQNGAEEAVRNQ